jgi:hypothetical protein
MDTARITLLFALGLACVAGAWMLVWQLQPEGEKKTSSLWLLRWLAQGLLIPSSVWTLMNVGLAWNLQPFMPAVQAAKNSGGNYVPVLMGVVAAGFALIAGSWAMTTLGWSLGVAWRRTRDEARARFNELCGTTAFYLALPALLILWVAGWPGIPFAVALILGTIAAYAPPIVLAARRPPMYSRAIARMKFGKYSDAEWEIIRELEKREDDFQGWMMLADLYANHFHDLKEAEKTVLEICTRPQTTAPELSIALHRLADWHLNLTRDLDGARFALGLICERLPGTHLAHMAQLRIHQLPASLEELRERQDTRAAVRLPALGDSFDESPPRPRSTAERKQAAALANACVERLEEDPANMPEREKLARLFAEELGKADLGIEQLNLMLEMPDQPELRRAEWLSLIAAWSLKYLRNRTEARGVLERLAREFPGTPQALAARRRLQLMDLPAQP